MSFDSSAIRDEIAPILNDNVNEAPYKEISAFISTSSIEELSLGRVIQLIEGHTFAQPEPSEPGGRVSPVSARPVVDVEIPFDVYTRDVYPHRAGLKMILYTKHYTFENGLPVTNEYSRVYKAVMIDEAELALAGNSSEITNPDVQAQIPPRTVSFELIDVAIEQLRGMTLGKPLRNQIQMDALRTYLHAGIDQLDVEDSNAIRGVDIVDPEDDTIYPVYIIPSFVRMSHIPHYFQRQLYGFYKSGMGSYIYRGIWYIFPKFNLEQFEERPDTLTVVNVPENRYPGIESTFFTVDGKTTVLATGKVTTIDDTETEQLNRGNGIRYGRAANIFFDEHTVNPGEITELEFEYERSVEEFAVSTREDGFNYLRGTKRRITGNDFSQSEELALGVGRYISIIWENSDPNLLYPGIPVRFLYETENGVETKYGLLHGMETTNTRVGNMPSELKFTSSTELLIYMER